MQLDERRETADQRGYDSQWRKIRLLLLAQQPICARCAEQGITTLAEDVHHIVPIRQDPSLRLAMSNLMPVCRQCHAVLEQETRQRHAVI